ncbi:uncharacterized protein LOC110343992 [Heterocephalus glaber]|uniref:Uncharacterized protein LOC110343992 n=1 Tax=Heterocephalus glaber TaxID=10181 RepID=A0AAX6R730_HETGA|nr:uncharacterized protein LOC110343992 [Heterocephalus glaber]
MGGSGSKNTPLDCFLTNFKLAFSPEQEDEYKVKFSRGKLRSLCQLEWPTFEVGWPAEGSFDLTPKPVLSQDPDPLDLEIRPPPYVEPSSSSDKVRPRSRNPFYPPLPEEEKSPDSVTSPSHTRTGAAYGPSRAPTEGTNSAPLLPLREVEQGHYVYIPFSTSDLYNWKHQNPPFSEKPQALISLLESVFNTHDPIWDDCQQLLQALFTSEERERIRGQAIKSVLGGSEGPLDEQQRARIEAQLPSIRPLWQANSSGGREALHNYRQHLLASLRGAARKPTNLSKV